ncbi:MAG TPA: hypothetical protein VGP53_00130, partial [Acidimicrobiales bacterium]|nr:hypothetical protein [Acidimicrobiales bacterium]
ALPRAQPAPASARRTRPADGAANGGGAKQTLLDLVEHVNTLSELMTSTSRASSAEFDALGDRVQRVVADLDSLQLRVVRSLASFDAVRLRVQTELADRPPLTDEDVDRIADAVTQRLLDHVRVETER